MPRIGVRRRPGRARPRLHTDLHQVGLRPFLCRGAEFDDFVEETSRNLAEALARHGRNADLLILPCCDQVLAACARPQLGRTRIRSAPHVLLWLLYGPHYLPSTDDPPPSARGLNAATPSRRLTASLGGAERLRRLQRNASNGGILSRAARSGGGRDAGTWSRRAGPRRTTSGRPTGRPPYCASASPIGRRAIGCCPR